MKGLRVAAEEAGATVFELPLRGGNAEFPAERFQARFRVNHDTRGFADITVALRESFHVAGLVNVTEAVLHASFASPDPAVALQPVLLKDGGAARIVLIEISRDFESKRTDYQRVAPSSVAEASE